MAAQEPALSQHTMVSQSIPFRTMGSSQGADSPQQLVFRPTAAGDSRSSARKRGRESTEVSQAQDPGPLYESKGSAIVGMTPSFGNKVAEFLFKNEPSTIAGSQVSGNLPMETADHYNSVLAYQAQNLGLSFPQAHSGPHNDIDPSIASPQVVPVSQEAQGMQQPGTHTGRTGPSQGIQSAGVSPRHGHFNVPAPQSGPQLHHSSGVPPPRSVNSGQTSGVGHPLDEGERRMAGAGFHGDHIQETSPMDWRAAKEDISGRQSAHEAQPFVASAPQNTASQSSSSAPANTQSVSQPSATNTKGRVPSPKTQRPISASVKAQTTPAKSSWMSTRVPAPRKAKVKSKPATRASGGVQKRKPDRVRQTTPPRPAALQPAAPKATVPQTAAFPNPIPSARREQQPATYVSGSGLGLTQDDVDRWQEERQNPYRLPSFNDAFGYTLMDVCLRLIVYSL
ncbi:hypothetical protein M440DRAFT_1397338 [Trichoderma longibrachiatum ATCC 18648]|uniref:Uncharacterized protein n=1 Tax=Trichoderma longibrachiatum ATCC 18648 TaxID=983965 RepID=A0A2T4CEQ2_TRILO|nr:hypothetical protein M440DRAFT_1397338 [Trichoderma longibrachiatum ATCC 18648]